MDKTYFVDLTNKLYRLTFFFPPKEPLRNRIRDMGDEILADVVIILEQEIEEKKEAAFRVERNIQILSTLLELSKFQNWIEEDKVKIVQDNYIAIKREVEEFNEFTRRKALQEGFSHKALKQCDPPPKFYTPKDVLPKSNTPQKEVSAKKSNPSVREQIRIAQKGIKKDSTSSLKLNERQKKIIQVLGNKEKMQVKDFQQFFTGVTKRTLRRDLSNLTDQKEIKRIGQANLTFYQLIKK